MVAVLLHFLLLLLLLFLLLLLLLLLTSSLYPFLPSSLHSRAHAEAL